MISNVLDSVCCLWLCLDLLTMVKILSDPFPPPKLIEQGREDQGLEASTGPHININTGLYFIRQWPGGQKFFRQWMQMKVEGPVKDRGIGHDQDGLNLMVRCESAISVSVVAFCQI